MRCLGSQPYVRLVDLLSLSWSAGIPVAHLRIFPAVRKRMAAMAVAVGERHAVLLAKDSMYPPHIAFYFGHELGHIALGHIRNDAAIVDMEADVLSTNSRRDEEAEADRFALELLTGRADLQLVPTVPTMRRDSRKLRCAYQANSKSNPGRSHFASGTRQGIGQLPIAQCASSMTRHGPSGTKSTA